MVDAADEAALGLAVVAAGLDFGVFGLDAALAGGCDCAPPAGLVCAINPGAAASKIPTIIVLTERMFLLIPFTVFLQSRA